MAATRASCASSSARPTSWTIRRRVATIRADSCRQTTPTVARTSIATRPLRSAPAGLSSAEDLVDQALAVPDDLAEAPPELDRLLLRTHLDQREPADRLLRLGERTV